MWSWRRHSPFEELGLPKKVFISHSYQDSNARERLLAMLPKSIEPYIFPPIKLPPEQMISDKLLDAIRACDGLIYLQGGASAQSFWVALERDYALRQGKPVFAFNMATHILSRDTSPALMLNVFISASQRDNYAALRIVEIMRQRYFEPWHDEGSIHPGDQWLEETMDGIDRALAAGGYVVALWSAAGQASRWTEAERERSDVMQPHRVLFALLDETPPPLVSWQGGLVQLYGDAERSQAQRIDDLIVRLYWLIYRNTRQNQLS